MLRYANILEGVKYVLAYVYAPLIVSLTLCLPHSSSSSSHFLPLLRSLFHCYSVILVLIWERSELLKSHPKNHFIRVTPLFSSVGVYPSSFLVFPSLRLQPLPISPPSYGSTKLHESGLRHQSLLHSLTLSLYKNRHQSIEAQNSLFRSHQSLWIGKAHSKTVKPFVAAAVGNLRRLKKLAREVDKNGKGIAKTLATAKDCVGQTVLHAAAAEGMTDICKYLVDDLKLDIHLKTTNGATPLLRACMDGHLSTVAYLLRKGADPNTRNDKGLTPLHYVAQIGHEELIRLLLSNGVNVDSLSSIGTPLQRAASEGKHEAVKILLDHCANPGLYFHHVPTPLSAAVAASSLRCVELLIEAGADPDSVSCGVTPLHIAACYEEIDIIKCLLKAEADADVTDDDGLKPIEAGALNGHDESVKILLPVTSPIPTYSDWSYSGIMRHVRSEEAGEQSKLKVNQMFEEMKSKGEEAFRKKDYSSAIFWYTKAINEDPSNAIVLSNRSLCWARMKEGKRALSDAMACITLKPDWPKAYYRAGAAYTILEKFDQAADVFLEGLKLAPENEDLRNALQEAVEARFKSMKANEEK